MAFHKKGSTFRGKTIISNIRIAFGLRNHRFVSLRDSSKPLDHIVHFYAIGVDCIPIGKWECFYKLESFTFLQLIVSSIFFRPRLQNYMNPWVIVQKRMTEYSLQLLVKIKSIINNFFEHGTFLIHYHVVMSFLIHIGRLYQGSIVGKRKHIHLSQIKRLCRAYSIFGWISERSPCFSIHKKRSIGGKNIFQSLDCYLRIGAVGCQLELIIYIMAFLIEVKRWFRHMIKRVISSWLGVFDCHFTFWLRL